MNTWFAVALGDGIEAYEPSQKIQEIFTPVFVAAGLPFDMAVFSRYDLDENIVTAYFSPSAHAIAKLFNATLCEKPSRPDLTLLVGDVRCWDIFFPIQNEDSLPLEKA